MKMESQMGAAKDKGRGTYSKGIGLSKNTRLLYCASTRADLPNASSFPQRPNSGLYETDPIHLLLLPPRFLPPLLLVNPFCHNARHPLHPHRAKRSYILERSNAPKPRYLRLVNTMQEHGRLPNTSSKCRFCNHS